MYDLIGDIHGHADALIRLLDALGYQKRGGVYSHPERRVIFLGDFVDRGPQIREALDDARRGHPKGNDGHRVVPATSWTRRKTSPRPCPGGGPSACFCFRILPACVGLVALAHATE